MYSWSFTKSEEGARVELMSGDWSKEQFTAEVEAHEDIIAHTAMQNKLKTAAHRTTSATPTSTSKFFATIGSR